jgi:hypothetical protein
MFDIWNITQIHQLKQVSLLFGDLYYLQACRRILTNFTSNRNK